MNKGIKAAAERNDGNTARHFFQQGRSANFMVSVQNQADKFGVMIGNGSRDSIVLLIFSPIKGDPLFRKAGRTLGGIEENGRSLDVYTVFCQDTRRGGIGRESVRYIPEKVSIAIGGIGHCVSKNV